MVDMRNSGCMLIGIERGEETYMNPEPDMIMQEGDIVWLVGTIMDYHRGYHLSASSLHGTVLK